MPLNKIDVFLSAEQIGKKISDLATAINKDYYNKELLIIGLMKGCLFFLADLSRKIKLKTELDIIYASSYKGNKSTGNVKVLLDLKKDIFGKHVLVLDDIVDTGLTLNKIKSMLLIRNPASLNFAVLFDKEECRIEPVNVKYVGFKLPNLFFIGYGMDYNGLYRELPYLGVLKDEF